MGISCADQLDLTDPNEVVANDFYRTESQVWQGVNGVYSQLQDIIDDQYLFNELPSDNTTAQINPQERGEANRVEALDLFRVEVNHENIAAMYNEIYNSLHNINTILLNIDDAELTDAKRNQYRGELLFLRAYYYFNLVQYFGPVVLLTEPVASPDESYEAGRSPIDAVYAQIIEDLTAASQLLPAKSAYPAEDVGRAPRGAALGLLGKVHLTRRNYNDAVTTLRQVNELGYSLLADYADIFDPGNKNHAESIFEVQHQGGNDLGEHSRFMYTFAPINSDGIITGHADRVTRGWNMPTNSMMDEYEAGDPRKAVSLQEGYTDGQGNFVAVPYISKYNHPHTLPGRTDDNWPVLRYADILLMLAEAINEASGPTGEAYDFLNQVRGRVGLDPLSGLNQTTFREAVLKERRVELAFENHRWFDLKRTLDDAALVSFLNAHGQEELDSPTIDRSGIAYRADDYVFDVHERYFPIPERQTILSDNIEQNPGYN